MLYLIYVCGITKVWVTLKNHIQCRGKKLDIKNPSGDGFDILQRVVITFGWNIPIPGTLVRP